METPNVNDDSTDDLIDKESNTDQEFIPRRVELSDIVLPTTSPPRPALNNGAIATPYVNQFRDNPQKRKHSPPPEPVTKKLCENLYEAIDDSSTDTEEYTITKIDDDNNFQNRNYIEESELLGEVVIKRDEPNDVRMKLQKVEDYLKVTNTLNNEPPSESNLSLKSPKQDADLTDNGSDSNEVLQKSWFNSNENVEYKDPLGLYGLQLEFLQSLEITPPLDRWVHVTNFRCDKSELRDVMELAGHVLSCSVIATTKRYAKVQYSHALEAVQAIAMLNGQTFYGWKLSVCMERNPRNDIILPKGLVNIGIGLGIAGRPIRDIVSQYKNFTRNQTSTINPVLFRKLVSKGSKEEIQKHEKSQIDFKALINSKRTFAVKHVEELDNADGVPSEKEKVSVKENNSPETVSIKSSDSSGSYHEVKDEGKVDKSNDIPQNYSHAVGLAQPDVLSSTIPIRVRQITPAVGFPRPIVAQNLRTQPLHSTPYRPGSSTPPVLTSNSQYPRHILDNSNARPLSVLHPMPNPIGNPPTPGPFGLSQPCKPLSPTGPPLVNNPGPVYGLTSMYSPGILPGPPLGHRPGPLHGPRPITGPGPVHLSNLGYGPGPNPGPSNLALGPGPSQGPPNFAHGPGPNPGPSNPAPGRGPDQGPSNVAHGPGPNQGPSSLAHGPGPNPGPSNLPPNHGPSQGPFNLAHVPGPTPGPSNIAPGLGPNQGPSNVAHGPGVNQGLGPVQGPGPIQVSGSAPLHNNINPVPGSVTGTIPTVHTPTKVDVEFANLPPTTTFTFLCEKLSQCGQITCLRFTTPGCAIASFSHPAHAERCFQNYNGMVVEGCRIVVKLV